MTIQGKRRFFINLCDVFLQDRPSANDKFLYVFYDRHETVSEEALNYYFDDHVLIFRFKNIYRMFITNLA